MKLGNIREEGEVKSLSVRCILKEDNIEEKKKLVLYKIFYKENIIVVFPIFYSKEKQFVSPKRFYLKPMFSDIVNQVNVRINSINSNIEKNNYEGVTEKFSPMPNPRCIIFDKILSKENSQNLSQYSLTQVASGFITEQHKNLERILLYEINDTPNDILFSSRKTIKN